MSMATLEISQDTRHGAPDVMFGDFSESEVASIIYNSKLFNKQDSLSFGTFSEEEINEILDASHAEKKFVEFDFEEVVAPQITPETSPVKTDEVIEETPEEIINGNEETPVITCPPSPPKDHPIVLDFSSSQQLAPQVPNLSTPERTDIDEVLKILIEETVKSSSFSAPPAPTHQATLQSSFPYSTQPNTWSTGPTAQGWPNPTKSSFTTDFYSAPQSTEQIWSKPPEPTSVWSNGTGNQWSSLFKNSDLKEEEPSKNVLPQILSENVPTSIKDHELMMLGSQLQLMTISHHMPVNIVPRGLINKSTNCFAHAPLQALLVSPLYHVIQQIDSSYALSPVLSAVKQFFKSFNPALGVVDKMDPPFEPTCIYEMLRNKMPNFNENGRQEDAEEFLGIILSNLHDEMVSAIRSAKKTVSLADTVLGSGDDGEWQQIGRKNKIQVTRNTSNNEPSPVSELFGGLTRSVVSKAGAKESATLQPFLSVQLDLQHQNITSVRDALCHFTHKEQIYLNDVKCYRRETLESLPPVLILHLKRFIFDDAAKSCQKLLKEIDFNIDMTISDDMMSAIGTTLTAERRYHLFGVVYHHGSHATGGHYSAMVYHPYIQCWVNADDDKVVHQDDNAVLKHIPGRSAYLLFYKRVA
ncbi:ubiquitin carboxyl-terminal hydrolase 10-B-like [Bolinopsis microptera]|uniref:ubiquitin carboxyl-terminal hydrolase 10-B-like n=1 Tax=Bolinopsis microptera TaxID=2820187 RepID=UPI00307A00D4